MPNFNKFRDAISGGIGGQGAADSGTAGAKQPGSMEMDMEQYRARVETIPPDAKTDLILDLFQNVTTDEIEAALSNYAQETRPPEGEPPAAPATGGM